MLPAVVPPPSVQHKTYDTQGVARTERPRRSLPFVQAIDTAAGTPTLSTSADPRKHERQAEHNCEDECDV